MALLAGVAITVTGCGSTSSPTSPSGTTTTTTAQDVSGVISANHGHVATVTAAQITSPATVSLNIQGTATHTHTVTLTADQVRSIGAKQQVAVTSTTDSGHQHTVTFN